MSKENQRINFKAVAVPTEHGGWGFLFEPILLGMLVAPSLPGLCYSVAVIAGFLLRRPLKLYIRYRDRSGASRYSGAGIVAFVYAIIALAAFVFAVVLGGWIPAIPLVVLGSLALVSLGLDTQNRGRSLLAELTGPAGLAAVAISIALTAGWSWAGAVTLWVLLMARTIPSIYYVRCRIRVEKGQPFGYAAVIVSHVVFVVVVGVLCWRGLAPVLALVAVLLLTARTLVGLSPYRRLKKAAHVGILEIIFGLIYVALVVVGFRTGV
jgi:hypothetical protein